MNDTYKVHRQFAWDDIPETVAIVGNFAETIDQCAILVEGRQVAHMFLLSDGLLALTDVELPDDIEPGDSLLLAIGRVLIAHRRAAREGRSLV